MDIRDTAGNTLFTQDILHATETHVAHLLDFKLLDLMADSSELATISTQYEGRGAQEDLYPSYAIEMKNLRFSLWMMMIDKLHETPADIMARTGSATATQ